MVELPPRAAAGGFVSARELPQGPNGRALCRRCSTEVPEGRRTFCSDGCITEWKIRTQPAYAAAQVEKRDKGVCAACGTDTAALRSEFRVLPHAERFDWLLRRGLPAALGSRRRWFDVDHVVPVVEGGGSCGLDNLRTLCVPCHRRVTAALATRRASARKTGS